MLRGDAQPNVHKKVHMSFSDVVPSASGPALLDAVVEPYALSLPPHVSFGEAEGSR